MPISIASERCCIPCGSAIAGASGDGSSLLVQKILGTRAAAVGLNHSELPGEPRRGILNSRKLFAAKRNNLALTRIEMTCAEFPLFPVLAAALLGAALAGACATSDLSETEQVREEVSADVPVQCDNKLALQLYERRIEPLFNEERPSSCSQCHLSGLELGLYVQKTPCETLACLVDHGLVDPKQTEDSKILSWISRAEPESDLITERVIAEEYEGLRQWIDYNLRCDACEGVVCPTAEGGKDERFCAGAPEIADDFDPASVDRGGCGTAELETLFRDTVFAGRGRCSPCHFNDFEAKNEDSAPQWIDVKDDCQSAVSRTLRNMERGEYFNLSDPAQSLFLLKPLPEELGGVKHVGHDKFYSVEEDAAYRAFLYFAERYAGCHSEVP